MEDSSEKKPAANRKRSRPESSQKRDAHRQDDNSEVCLQSPHTLRLLKLIEEGTLEHARIAASHLASLSASPIVLWDLLGRLQAFLCSPQWSTRLHASLAMQGVAQHIPPSNQQEFLEATYSGPLWLTVDEVSRGLETILTDGRVLLAECDTKQDSFASQEDRLKQLDEAREQLSEDFVERRVRLQREILAQRLGLSGVVHAVGESVLTDVITKEDLFMNDDADTYSTETQQHIKRQHRDDNEDHSGSIRALLVMEMQQQQDRSIISGATSHKNPQTLLATELIYRMFDPSWHVRHGALLGTLSLLRAWKDVVGDRHSFGVWPHDILARCLCVLSLDRFGDYGGTEIGKDGGDSVVAPVREIAGQLLSVLWSMAPESVQQQCLKVLVRLSSRDLWEARHGALLALKYIIVLSSSNLFDRTTDASLVSTIKEITIVAQERLCDKMEDVQSVAAQIIFSVLSGSHEGSTERKELIQASIVPLWDGLGRLQSVSSCAGDLVNLFSAMISSDCLLGCTALSSSLPKDACILSEISDKLVSILRYDSMAMKLSALNAIGRIAGSFASSMATSATEMPVQSFCSLLEWLFESYVADAYATVLHMDDAESQRRLECFFAAREAAWTRLVACARSVFNGAPLHRKSLLIRLLLSFGKIRQQAASELAGALNVRSADAFARLVIQLDETDKGSTGKRSNFLESFICLLVHSPWMEHFESACLLYQALNSHECRLLRRSHDRFCELLVDAPSCLSPNLKDVSSVLSEAKIIKSMEEFLNSAMDDVNECSCKEAEQFWYALLDSERFDMLAVKSDDEPLAVTTSSMRINSLIAGAIISGGGRNLPPRLTPLVRALMTSLKSERCPERQMLTCESLALLLRLLSEDESRLRVKTKIVENVCNMIASDNNTQGGDFSRAAAHVLVLLVSELPPNKTLVSIPPVWNRLSVMAESYPSAVDDESLSECLRLLQVICEALERGSAATRQVIEKMVVPLIPIACMHRLSDTRTRALNVIVSLCRTDSEAALDTTLPLILTCLADKDNGPRRLGSLRLLQSIIEGVGMDICPFVHCLLPATMSLMTDSLQDCAKQAAQSFAALVRVSPLVKQGERRQWETETFNNHSDQVIDHLIHGKPLPPCVLPDPIMNELKSAGVSLRDYQIEGISWLRFLEQVKLNGILADDMGLGKTLQALVAVALSHHDHVSADESARPISLVVCPSTLVGHWLAEIRKFFPQQTKMKGTNDWGTVVGPRGTEIIEDLNVVVVSYSTLRRDVKILSTLRWHYCILDEGHLLKNPKTATAIAARRLRAEHKLILTGTPVQNRVHELWAAFDFLMPNFLGSQSWFTKNFARPISNGQLPGASAESISDGMEKLKVLHQQVLPFILRREKEYVMKELPPKCIIDIPCELTSEQQCIYETFCHGADAKRAVAALRCSIDNARHSQGANGSTNASDLGGEAFKSLLYLRLLCTHPSLVAGGINANSRCDCSGKLMALNQLLRTAHLCGEELTAADNDTSALYIDFEERDTVDDASAVLNEDAGDVLGASGSAEEAKGSKCLIFAQFTQSLDVVERLLFRTQMPSLRYVRLDGSVPPDKRGDIVHAFNNDDSITVMLLTSRVGSLGLNLTGASTVIFLEHDYNPHADLQAMDRAHRIGQTKTVNVYRLITQNTIEEKIMKLQQTKMAMSKAIVNSENTTMYSMGTERLLDIFTFRSDADRHNGKRPSSSQGVNLDAIEEEYTCEDYASLSLESFIDSFKCIPDSR